MTPKELLQRAGENNGMAFILLSTARMYTQQTEDDLFRLKMKYSGEIKYTIKRSVELCNQLNKSLSVLDTTLFKSHNEDDLFDENAFYYDILKLINEKAGGDTDKRLRLRAMIQNLKL